MYRDQEGWIDCYKKKNALWIHDGNIKRPHALLTSGKHSNGFFNSRLVIPDEVLLYQAATDLVSLLSLHDIDLIKIQGVIGPQTGATRLAELIRNQISSLFGPGCFWASPAKGEVDGFKRMVFSSKDRSLISGGEKVLLCEDVLTTGGSVDLTVEAIVREGGSVLPFILVLVNRSGLTEVRGKKIVALINHSMPIWESEECPLCKQGSEAIRPKENWARLNAEY